jgi:PAS domain S-box-containing protein
MISVNTGPHTRLIDKRQQNSEVRRAVLHASSQLAECESEKIEHRSQLAVDTLGKIEQAEGSGWYLLDEPGTLRDLIHSTHDPLSPCSIFDSGLHELPWCLARVASGDAVVVNSLSEMHPSAETDRQFLRARGVRSLALLPSNSVSSGRTILVMLSTSTEIIWSDEIVEQCTLLGNILCNAYQRRLAHDEARDTIECFHRLFVSSTTPMATVNSRGQFLSTNGALRDILGYSEDQFRQMKCNDIINLADQCDKASLLRYLADQTMASHLCERDLIRSDLSLIPARIEIRLIDRGSAHEARSLISIEDITEYNIRKNELCRRKAEVDLLASQLIHSQENERKHLSRELHDDIGQRLSMATSDVALLASQHSEDTPISVDRLNTLRDELDELCSDVHEMSHNLHSSKLEHLGLKAALKDLSRKITQPNFRVDLRADQLEEPASRDVALCLYRIAQESLNNALKHSRTPVVALTLTKLQSTFYMTIQDSGIGFDSSVRAQGIGLLSMSERVKLLNGQFRLRSIPGRGTEIWVEIPDDKIAADLLGRTAIHTIQTPASSASGGANIRRIG